MRLCIPLLHADTTELSTDTLPLAAHFGLASHFAVLDSTNGEVLGACAITGRCPGPCACPLPQLADGQVDALVTQALGFRVMQLSKRNHLPVLTTQAATLGELRHTLRQQPLTQALDKAVCMSTGRRPKASPNCQPS